MKIKIGNLTLGDSYIPVQTMIKNSILDIDLTLNKIENLYQMGCDIIRVAVNDLKSIDSLKKILKYSKIPVVADIHFDHNLAIKSCEIGVHKIRINPGNIVDESKIKKVIDCAKLNRIPIRIGINCGSLPKDLLKKYPDNTIKIMMEAAKREINYFTKYDYHNVVLSFKSSSVSETIEINRLAKNEFEYPLHIGVTEAGDLMDGTVKNSCGISILLSEGIGDTIRVSLTSSEENEIIVGKKILESLGKRIPDIEIISCPTCGRTTTDIENLVINLKDKIKTIKKLKKKLKVAVMGCEVNGPGESKNADFGVACGKQKSIIFAGGVKLKVIKNNLILDELLMLIKKYEE